MKRCSTTQLLTGEVPDSTKQTKEKIIDTNVSFETILFLPEMEGRKGEGGLRTKGFFKTSTPDRPLITVITVVFNGEAYLEETIQSVINQTYDNVEYIIIDGGRKYEEKIDYWVSERDRGISDAFNKGITVSTGIRLLFLNAGDHFYKESILADLQQVFLDHPDTDLIYGKIMLVDSNQNAIKAYGKPQNFNVLRRHMTLPHQAMFHHISFFKKNGLYDVNIKTSMDYALIMKNFKNIKLHFVDKIISNMLSDGVSQTHIFKLYKEHLAIQLRYHLNAPIISYLYFGLNIFSFYIKKTIKRCL